MTKKIRIRLRYTNLQIYSKGLGFGIFFFGENVTFLLSVPLSFIIIVDRSGHDMVIWHGGNAGHMRKITKNMLKNIIWYEK